MTADEILPRLWVGDIQSAHDPEFLRQHSINCIINCTTSLPFPKHPAEKHRVPVKDNLEPEEIQKMYDFLDPMADLIHRSRPNMNILVHCHMGKQRSVSVVIAYLIKYGKVSLRDAIGYFRTKRDTAMTPGINFLSALKKYERFRLK